MIRKIKCLLGRHLWRWAPELDEGEMWHWQQCMSCGKTKEMNF